MLLDINKKHFKTNTILKGLRENNCNPKCHTQLSYYLKVRLNKNIFRQKGKWNLSLTLVFIGNNRRYGRKKSVKPRRKGWVARRNGA